ncbi:MAG: hypothetical protein JRJ60_20095, partial [Deltaproteobacteria bacterium]|nr:hypothetical protein [Deltaproteobacteria bacterium]
DITGLEIRSPETPEAMTAAHATVSFDFRNVLRGRIVPRRIVLRRPGFEISFSKDATGDFMARGMPELLGHILAAFPSISMDRGSVRISDPPIVLEDLRLEAEQIQPAPMRLMISLTAVMRRKGGAIPLSLTASVDPEADEDIPFVEGSLESDAFPLDLFPWTDDFSSKKGKARASLKFRITPKGRVEADGRILAEDVRFRLKSDGRKKDFPLSYLALDFESAFDNGRIEVPSFRLSGPRFYAKGAFRLDARDQANPYLFLEVESSDIEMDTAKKVCPTPLLPSWIESRLYPDLKAGKVRLERLLIDGRLDQIMALEQAANAGVFSIRINWKDVAWRNDMLPWRFERVPGTMEIREGRFRMSGITGRFGGSVVEKGEIESENVFRSGAPCDIAMAGRFDTEQLLILRDKGLIPGTGQDWFDRIASVSGMLQTHIRARFEDDWKSPRLMQGDFQGTDCTLVHQDLGMPVDWEVFHFEFDKKGASRFQGRGRWGASTFDLSGNAFSADDIRAQVNGTAVPAEVLSFFLGTPPAFLEFHDPVQYRFDLERQSGTWAYRGEMGVQGITLQTDRSRLNFSPEIKKIQAHGKLLPHGEIRIQGAECRWGESVFHLSGTVDIKKGTSFSVDVASPGVRLADLGLEVDGTVSPPQGLVSGRVRINGAMNAPSWRVSLTGKMEGQGISFALKDHPVTLQDGDFSLNFDDNRLKLRSARVTVGEVPLHVLGNFKGWEPIAAELDLYAEALDLEQALTAFRSGMSKGFSGPGPASRIGAVDFRSASIAWNCAPITLR